MAWHGHNMINYANLGDLKLFTLKLHLAWLLSLTIPCQGRGSDGIIEGAKKGLHEARVFARFAWQMKSEGLGSLGWFDAN